MRRAVFLDRDGTLLLEKHYLSRPEDVELQPGCLEALHLLRGTGLALVLVSNQSGVARGFFGEADVAAVHRRLTEMLAEAELELDGIYYCPHLPDAKVAKYRRRCACRKPQPGMLEKAAAELDLELAGSWVIGDKRDDLELGLQSGMRTILVRSGHGLETEAGLSAGDSAGLEAVSDDILAAARWISAREDLS